jgi:hypothetical protein
MNVKIFLILVFSLFTVACKSLESTSVQPVEVKSKSLKIEGPDLAVTAIQSMPTVITAGNKVQFSAIIQNIGSAPTPNGRPINVRFIVDGNVISISNPSTAALAAGESRTMIGNVAAVGSDVSTWTASLGTHVVRAYVDFADRFVELDESNNNLVSNIEVGGSSDLKVSILTYSPTNVIGGNSVLFSATVKNDGNVATPVGKTIVVQFKIDGNTFSSSSISTPLAAGETITLASNSWTAVQGTHAIAALADATNQVAESNELNNSTNVNLSVSAAQGVQAIAADAFVDSIGINTHLNWGGTVWDTKSNEWMPLLHESGIRYVRALIGTNALAKNLLTRLYDQYGIRADASFNLRDSNNRVDPTKIQTSLNYLRDQVGAEKIISIESANEYNESKHVEGNVQWATQLRDFQQQLYMKTKNDVELRHLPVLAPSVWKNIIADANELGNLDAFADLGTLHYYTGGRRPTINGLNNAPHTIEDAIGWAKQIVPSAPMYVTEAGYNNMTDSVDSPFATPEKTQAKYSLRVFAEFFKRNDKVSKTFMYNFMDDPRIHDKIYGFLAQPEAPSTALRRRPVFYAVKNAIKIMSDVGPAFTPDSLAYTLTGDKTNVVSILTEKRNGRFYLMIWQDVDSIDRMASPPLELNPPARNLTLSFTGRTFSTVKIYTPTAIGMSNPDDGALPIRTITTQGPINLAVPDHVMIVEMIP